MSICSTEASFLIFPAGTLGAPSNKSKVTRWKTQGGDVEASKLSLWFDTSHFANLTSAAELSSSSIRLANSPTKAESGSPAAEDSGELTAVLAGHNAGAMAADSGMLPAVGVIGDNSAAALRDNTGALPTGVVGDNADPAGDAGANSGTLPAAGVVGDDTLPAAALGDNTRALQAMEFSITVSAWERDKAACNSTHLFVA